MPLIFIVQQPQPRFQTALSYVTYLFSEWRIPERSTSSAVQVRPANQFGTNINTFSEDHVTSVKGLS